MVIEHSFIFVLNENFANCALNESSLIVQSQFSLKIKPAAGNRSNIKMSPKLRLLL